LIRRKTNLIHSFPTFLFRPVSVSRLEKLSLVLSETLQRQRISHITGNGTSSVLYKFFFPSKLAITPSTVYSSMTIIEVLPKDRLVASRRAPILSLLDAMHFAEPGAS
jgi:hypothetical protein